MRIAFRNDSDRTWELNEIFMSTAKISAYIPCFNNRGTLHLALDSVRGQSHPVDEIMIVDDGSADGTYDAICGEKDIRIVTHASNLGRGAARSTAMSEARHELVLGCDATVTLSRDFVKNALPWFEDPRVAAVFGCNTQPPASDVVGRWRGRHLFKSQRHTQEVNFSDNFATTGALVRASAIHAAGGFDRTMRGGEDAELSERLIRHGFQIVYDPTLSVKSVSSNTLGEVLERYTRWNTHRPITIPDFLRLMSYSIKYMAWIDLRSRDPLAALISLITPMYMYWWAFRRDFRSSIKTESLARILMGLIAL